MSKVNFVNTVSISELRKVIPLIGGELTPVIQSEPGCGKTSLLSMIASDNGDKWRSPKDGTGIEGDKYDYIYVDCPVKDMSDIGMTIPDPCKPSVGILCVRVVCAQHRQAQGHLA